MSISRLKVYRTAVVSQTLLPRIEGDRIAVFGIMIATSVIRRLICEEKVHEIHPNIEMGKLEGTQTLDQALADLVRNGVVAEEAAMMRSSRPEKLHQALQLQDEATVF